MKQSVSPTGRPAAERRKASDPVLGTACCIGSAVCYSGANICLRQLSAIDIDPAWVICLKESVAVVVVGPWLAVQLWRGWRFPLSRQTLAALAAIGLAVQLAGNLPVQWAFGVVGLTISMPAVFGAMLIGSALIGALWLGERISSRSLAAVCLLIFSIALLAVGAAADLSQGAPPGGANALLVLLGIGAACLGGAMFASLGAAVRWAVTARVPIPVVVVLVTGMGVVSLGAVSLVRLGPGGMLATAKLELAWMVASGLFNLAAFALISKGLQLTALVRASVLNAAQVALGAAAGVLLFREPLNLWLAGGIVLTILGIAVMGRPPADDEQALEAV